MKIKSICRYLILVAIMLTPIFNIGEVVALFSGKITTSEAILTPLYLKFVKDSFFLLILFAGALELLIRRRVMRSGYLIAFLFLVVISIVITLATEIDAYTILAGIRWALPIFLILFVYKTVDEDLQKKIAHILVILAAFAFVIQIFQLFFMQKWYGVYFGLNLRNPGFYFIPSSMAMFTMVAMCYISNYMQRNHLLTILLNIVFPVSVIMTGSGTGVVALILFYIIGAIFRIKEKWFVAVMACCLIAFAVITLPVITARSRIYDSLMNRVEIFVNSATEHILVSDSYGAATNTSVSLGRAIADSQSGGFVADSTLTSVAYNTGLFSLLIFMAFLFSYFRLNKPNAQFWAIYLPFIATVIIFELFPINLIFAVNMAYFHKKLYKNDGVKQLNEKTS